MLSILNQWNRWGSALLSSGFAREIVTQIYPFVDTPEVVTLVGMRRAGKTTILYQLMDYLQTKNVALEAMLHINFEEPALAPDLKLELLDTLYRTYREKIYPKGKAYLFLDEIQNVPGWERWVRARNEIEDIKIFLTGSSASLMSRELATLLTGRHVTFHVTPLSFYEYLIFKKIEMPKKIINVDPTPTIQNAFEHYIQWGGLPEIVLSEDENRSKLLLKQYFDDLLFKDIAMRHQIRDIVLLRNLAVYLLTQTASLISMSRIAKLFGISPEMAGNYCHYIQESYLVHFMPFFSLKVAERNRNSQKVYAYDIGLRNIVSLTQSPDYGRLMETIIFQHLNRKFNNDVFYWKGKHEIDFVIREGITITQLIQVCYDSQKIETLQREINALVEAKQQFSKASEQLIVNRMPKEQLDYLCPIWRFLLI